MVGWGVGFFVGYSVGFDVGVFVGNFVGNMVGWKVGFSVGSFVGFDVGFVVGNFVGAFMGGGTIDTNTQCTMVISMKTTWNVALQELLKSPEHWYELLGGVTVARYTISTFDVEKVALQAPLLVVNLSRTTLGLLESNISTTVPATQSPEPSVTVTTPWACSGITENVYTFVFPGISVKEAEHPAIGQEYPGGKTMVATYLTSLVVWVVIEHCAFVLLVVQDCITLP